MSMKRNDDAALFRRVFERNYRALLGYALRRTPDRVDAEDVVSETFTVVWRRFSKLPGDEWEQRLWLYGIARKVLSNQHRSTARASRLNQRVQTLDQGESPAADASIEDTVDIAEALDALDALSERDRELVALALWEELTNAEIAKATGTSVANVSVRLHRAKKRLRGHFERSVQERPGGGHVSTRRATPDRAQEETG